MVQTPDGQRAIDEIKQGESVLAFDFERGEWVVRSVIERHDNNYDGPVITLRTSGGTVTTTAYHPFWVQEGCDLPERSKPRELAENEDEGLSLAGRWVNSHELRAGDVLVTNSGETTRLLGIEQHYDPKFRVCNLTIDTNHSFAVGSDSILVHNTPGCNRHIAESNLYGPRGGHLDSRLEISGVDGPIPKGTRLSFPDQSWLGHTEGKIISDLWMEGKLGPGRTLVLDGVLPPCTNCRNIMQWASENFKMTLEYADANGNVWTWIDGVLQ